MAIIKCKMCGGDIVLNEEKTIGTCEYCGTQMTLPRVSDEQRAALFNRGNHFRRQGEFDKALAVYENIVREDDTDAEAHWCCALCRFGIEYVEDPNTYEYIPTCHRASFDSFLEDVDYVAAIENSDGITRRQYQKDAAKIAEVQRGILATSQNEEPFDVFICYKETDDTTKERTRDSLDAQEIYYQLTQEGYRVFFSRITLEDKVGTEYEPYIFAALNSAKVMVAIGSKPEYFNAVWVKNEWSRFLAMMRKDRSKLLLPCYKNMEPYDLPEQLSVLQSYDMAKIGFMQDLIRGIKKVLAKDVLKQSGKVNETVVINSGNANISPLLERITMFLEDGNWKEADEYCEKVLDLEPQNAYAYMGKYLAKKQKPNFSSLISSLNANLNDDTKERLIACEEDNEYVERKVKDNIVKGYLSEDTIRNLYSFDTSYESVLASRIKHKKIYEQEISQEKSLSRARQFADGELKQEIENNLAGVVEILDQRIDEAKKKDQEQVENIKIEYTRHLQATDRKVAELRQNTMEKLEQKYRNAIDKAEKAKTLEDSQLRHNTFLLAISELKDTELYKDSKKRIKLLLQEMSDSDQEAHKQKLILEEKEKDKKTEKQKKQGVILLFIVLGVIILLTIIILLLRR